ncbi:DUF349 domain-containing protein [Gayadomonas joobiniege]|uniref:DUF349 domain-containing protein n=1 Tax=Gayadomonas joobiniege TaxID=1234606 RepID=UPI00037980AA|nr:DUF349 domain-containing protein [Gayadomonas joobiniege]
MIFKQLFTPKWQHSDAKVRQKALSQLEDKNIIRQIAEQDLERDIRRQALEKLSSFADWLRAHQTEKDAFLKKVAYEKVKAALVGETLSVSQDDKLACLQHSSDMQLVEDVLRLSRDPVLRSQALERVTRQSILLEIVMRDTDAKIAVDAFKKLDCEQKQLEKIVQKAQSSAVVQLAQARLDEARQAAEQVTKLQQETTLVLSKLLSLRDKTDYLNVKGEVEALTTQWQQLVQAFAILPAEQQTIYEQKYQQIYPKVEAKLAQLKKTYEAQLAEQQAAQAKQQLIAEVSSDIKQIETTLAEAINGEHHGENIQDTDAINKKISASITKLQLDHSGGSQIEKLFNQLNQLKAKSERLPEYAEQISQATRLIAQLNEQPIPDNSEAYPQAAEFYANWSKKWRSLQHGLIFKLPLALEQSSGILIQQWQQALKQIEQQQNSQLRQIRGQMRELERLIREGHFNMAFGLFKKISAGFSDLSELSQQKVERDYQRMNEQIEELTDWKAYIGLPRKRELLAEMQSVAAETDEDVLARARKIKQMRQTWRLLGNVDGDENQHLNQAFDEAAELAFAPCREKFAELDAQRQKNLIEREKLISQLTNIEAAFNQQQDYKQLRKSLTQVQQAWKSAGPVERKDYLAVSEQYFARLKPLKQILNDFYKQNSAAKQALIEQAEAVREGDLEQASARLKDLQKAWKQIGFAGPREDNQLWQKFRQINDQVFNQLQTEFESQQAQQNSVYEMRQNELEALTQSLSDAQDEKTLDVSMKAVKALDLADLTPAQKRKIQRQQSEIEGQILAAKKSLSEARKAAEYEHLVAVLEQLLREPSDELPLTEINPRWHKAISAMQQPAKTDMRSRHDATIKLEILTQTDSPAADKDRRMALQVAMLSDKLNQGDELTSEHLLINWLSAGPMLAEQSQLFNRLKVILKRL